MRIGAIFKILLIELVAIVALSAGDRELKRFLELSLEDWTIWRLIRNWLD